MAVFDSVAATEFVEKENVILWTPGGLDLLEHLAQVVNAVRQRLEQAASAIATRGPLPQPQPGTAASVFLQGIKDITPPNSIDTAAPWAARIDAPAQVLSEGERRGIALAAFLAELGTRDDKSTVVLDDPVSSLDHERRSMMAHRLAECAKDRQVIVFTHDLVFLHMLKAAANECGVAVTDREIRRAGTTAGYCRNKTPAKAMTVKALVGELRAHQQGCVTQHRAGELDAYERDLTQGYGLLREAWERAVEELLFNQAVMRFDHRVQTQRLKQVHDICQDDLDTINAGMTVCSKWLPGHTQASAINQPLPEPQDFLAKIQRLEDFVQGMRQRGRN